MSWKRRGLLAGFAAMLAAGVAVLGVVGGLWYAIDHPEVICRATERALDWPEHSIEVGSLEVGWDGRFRIEEIEVTPPEVRAPVVIVASVEADWPSAWKAYHRILDFGKIVATGVDIRQRMQRAPVHRPAPDKAFTLVASSVSLIDAAYFAPPDPPFKEVHLEGIDAHLMGVQWVPAAKRIDGMGFADVAQMQLGTIDISDLSCPAITLANGNMELGATTFYYGRTEGQADGWIRHIDTRPEVEITVRLAGDRIETAVEDAMGRQSPIMGWLSAELTIFAGGELERGDSRFDGWVQLSDAYVFMGNNMKVLPKLLLDVAPWFQRDDGGWLSVGDLRGEAKFGRGWVELERLERPSEKHRVLQAWGALRDGTVDLTIRAIPKKNADKKAGLGVRVRGPLSAAKIKLAKKDELREAPEIIVIE